MARLSPCHFKHFYASERNFMVLEKKQTTVAYRCPHCGAGVMSIVDVFTLGADMIKLRCSCHNSEMTIVRQKDSVRLVVPCILCPKPHSFTVSSSVFFGKDEFFLQCPYSDMNICFIGDQNIVKAELARGELELLELMEKNGISDFSALHEEEEEYTTDPESQQMALFVVRELEADGKIYCRCKDDSEEDRYEVELTSDGIEVSCRECGAKRHIPTDNSLELHAFLDSDSLYLE